MLPVFSDIAALFLGWLMLGAGRHKLRPRYRPYYRELIAGYGLRNEALIRAAVPVLGAVECLLGLLILHPSTRTPCALGAGALLLGYALLMAYALFQGKHDLNCGCGGPASEVKVSPWLIARNTALVTPATLALLPGAGVWSLQGVVAVPAALLGILIYLCFEQWLGNQHKLESLRR